LWLSILHCHIHAQFLVHTSVVGHLGCFQGLGVVNSAAMDVAGVSLPFLRELAGISGRLLVSRPFFVVCTE
jgi:hypothetical protein